MTKNNTLIIYKTCPICGSNGQISGCSRHKNGEFAICYSVDNGNATKHKYENEHNYWIYNSTKSIIPKPKLHQYFIQQHTVDLKLNEYFTDVLHLLKEQFIFDYYQGVSDNLNHDQKQFLESKKLINNYKHYLIYFNNNYINKIAGKVKEDFIHRLKQNVLHMMDIPDTWYKENNPDRDIAKNEYKQYENQPFNFKYDRFDLPNGIYRMVQINLNPSIYTGGVDQFNGMFINQKKYEKLIKNKEEENYIKFKYFDNNVLAYLDKYNQEHIIAGTKNKKPIQVFHYPIDLQSYVTNHNIVRLTEGVFNTDICTINTGIMTIHIPGISIMGNLNEFFQNNNIKQVLIAIDPNKLENPNVKAALFNQLNVFKLKYNFDIIIETWDKNFKSLSEAIINKKEIFTYSFEDYFYNIEDFIEIDGTKIINEKTKFNNVVKIPQRLIRDNNLTNSEKLIYVYIKLESDNNKFSLPKNNIILKSGYSKRLVYKGINALIKNGYLKKEDNKNYKLLIKNNEKITFFPGNILSYDKKDISHDAKVCLMVLCSYMNPHTLLSFPSSSKIQKQLNLSLNVYNKSIENLLISGFISKDKMGRFTIHFSPTSKGIDSIIHKPNIIDSQNFDEKFRDL